jgi:hypothetical protein
MAKYFETYIFTQCGNLQYQFHHRENSVLKLYPTFTPWVSGLDVNIDHRLHLQTRKCWKSVTSNQTTGTTALTGANRR